MLEPRPCAPNAREIHEADRNDADVADADDRAERLGIRRRLRTDCRRLLRPGAACGTGMAGIAASVAGAAAGKSGRCWPPGRDWRGCRGLCSRGDALSSSCCCFRSACFRHPAVSAVRHQWRCKCGDIRATAAFDCYVRYPAAPASAPRRRTASRQRGTTIVFLNSFYSLPRSLEAC